jgi:hypothetical protein
MQLGTSIKEPAKHLNRPSVTRPNKQSALQELPLEVLEQRFSAATKSSPVMFGTAVHGHKGGLQA